MDTSTELLDGVKKILFELVKPFILNVGLVLVVCMREAP
jgi:hypothetical protein